METNMVLLFKITCEGAACLGAQAIRQAAPFKFEESLGYKYHGALHL
jgi:hypothetical protein